MKANAEIGTSDFLSRAEFGTEIAEIAPCNCSPRAEFETGIAEIGPSNFLSKAEFRTEGSEIGTSDFLSRAEFGTEIAEIAPCNCSRFKNSQMLRPGAFTGVTASAAYPDECADHRIHLPNGRLGTALLTILSALGCKQSVTCIDGNRIVSPRRLLSTGVYTGSQPLFYQKETKRRVFKNVETRCFHQTATAVARHGVRMTHLNQACTTAHKESVLSDGFVMVGPRRPPSSGLYAGSQPLFYHDACIRHGLFKPHERNPNEMILDCL